MTLSSSSWPFYQPREPVSSSRFQTEEESLVVPPGQAGIEKEGRTLNVPERSSASSYALGRSGANLRKILFPLFVSIAVLLGLSLAVLVRNYATRHYAPFSHRNNLASSVNGAVIVPKITSGQYIGSWTHGTSLKPRKDQSRPHTTCRGPTALIEPQIDYSACWTIDGSYAQLGVLLETPALITNVSIGHISVLATPTAPRDIVIWGVVDGMENHYRHARFSTTFQA
ncbi:hypothetical protein K474DRAFT_1714297, partial [Panus rudis PR-1116 ss-1]